MPRAIIYGRVSTAKQKASGGGEMAQEDDCSDFARRMGYEVAGLFLEDDAVSGGKPLDKRPALIAAISELRKGDVLVVARRDRLARGDVLMTAMIEREVTRRKCRILSAAGEGTADDTGESVFIRRIFDAVAELAKFQTRCRTRSSSAAKRRRGLRVGQSPYGWTVDLAGPVNELSGKPVALAAQPEEQRVLALMEGWREEGWTLRRIADELNARGVPTKRGALEYDGPRRAGKLSGSWTHSTVDSILKSAPQWRAHAQAQGDAAGVQSEPA